MRRVRLTWLARLVWPVRGQRARQPHPQPQRATSLAWAVAHTSAHSATRPRVASAIQAAYAAQTTRATPGHWAVYGWGCELDEQQPARSPFDARRAQAWQAIDLTLAELRAS